MPRIGVSGSAGTGKSTLCQSLSDRLDIPYVPEGMRERLERGLDPHGLSHREFRQLLLTLFQQMITPTEAEIRKGGGVVCDRSPIDYVAFWLYYGFGSDEDSAREFFAEADAAMTRFDLIVLLPWGAIPLVADGFGSPNRWRQLHFQTILEGLAYRRFGSACYHYLPPDVARNEDRMAWILDRFGS